MGTVVSTFGTSYVSHKRTMLTSFDIGLARSARDALTCFCGCLEILGVTSGCFFFTRVLRPLGRYRLNRYWG